MHEPERLLSPRFSGALSYAAELHRSQKRKGNEIPYVSHLLAVCAIVLEHGGTEDEAIAALLHDGPEDQGGRVVLEEIRALYGERVARIVEGCCDTFEHPKPPWETRKAAYLEHLAAAGASVLLVSAADKLHNATVTLRDVRGGRDVWSVFNADRERVLWYYRSLIEAYDAGTPDPRRKPLVEELRKTVEALAK